jgi:hypothetical protein
MSLAISDRLPSRDQLHALDAIADPNAQDVWLSTELDRQLAEPSFYDAMVEFGHMWMNVPPVAPIADSPEYGLVQTRSIIQCPAGTLHEGKWGTPACGREGCPPCNGIAPDGSPAVIRTIEPWWAEGTTIEVIGFDGIESQMVEGPNGPVDCGRYWGQGWRYEAERVDDNTLCGCGPNLTYCYPAGQLQSWPNFMTSNPEGHRRLMWDEPARLFAHIAWHDRPLDDLILGAYSVGPSRVQHAYVRYARRLGAAVELDENTRWWRASTWTTPTDPHHNSTDSTGWSEFPVSDRNPFLLAERDYRFDPRVEVVSTMRGVPAAGVLSMPGFLAGMPRERIRGARVLEMFACESFAPPAPTAQFAPYTNDPASGGPCMTCHARIDPASIHFKRFMRVGDRFNILGVGNAHVSSNWTRAEYPFGGDPWDRMRRLWVPETRMTPVDMATAMSEPESRYIDFLPPDQTLYGATSDGTVGPLGLGKLLIDSGVFDRCAVRRLHERFVGRDVDPTSEAGYLQLLVDEFVGNGRRIRPFVRYLMQTEAFGRGL